jgi:hypothetical protein
MWAIESNRYHASQLPHNATSVHLMYQFLSPCAAEARSCQSFQAAHSMPHSADRPNSIRFCSASIRRPGSMTTATVSINPIVGSGGRDGSTNRLYTPCAIRGAPVTTPAATTANTPATRHCRISSATSIGAINDASKNGAVCALLSQAIASNSVAGASAIHRPFSVHHKQKYPMIRYASIGISASTRRPSRNG